MATKFENWKMSVDIDYLSMYIKTWFAFLATAKELYPNAISSSGDGTLINEYKRNLSLPHNYETEINHYIEEVFKLGEEIIKRDFPESYFGYYYILNKSYQIEKQIPLGTSSTKDANNRPIKDFLKLKILFKENHNEGNENNLYIVVNSNQNKFYKQLNCHFLDCKVLIKDLLLNDFYKDKEKIVSQIQLELQNVAYAKINMINGLNSSKIEERKGYANGLIIPLIQAFRNDFRPEILFQPQPFKDFPFNYDLSPNKLKILQWFIQFNYSLRNIMFHHVIDPFDEKWLMLFKYAYLALQEVVNHNIKTINLNSTKALT
jgi:hypothetical protein